MISIYYRQITTYHRQITIVILRSRNLDRESINYDRNITIECNNHHGNLATDVINQSILLSKANKTPLARSAEPSARTDITPSSPPLRPHSANANANGSTSAADAKSDKRSTIRGHKQTTSTPVSVDHLFKLLDKHANKMSPTVPCKVPNPNQSFVGYDAGFAHYLDLLNRGKSGETLSSNDIIKNYEIGQSYARDLRLLLEGRPNETSSRPEPIGEGLSLTNGNESLPPSGVPREQLAPALTPLYDNLTPTPNRGQLLRPPLDVNVPSPKLTMPSGWEQENLPPTLTQLPNDDDQPLMPKTPDKDPHLLSQPPVTTKRPITMSKPKGWIPRHAVEMEFKKLNKMLTSKAVEAVVLSIGLFVDIVTIKAHEQSKANKLQLHCLREELMRTRYSMFFHFDGTPTVAAVNVARSHASAFLARSNLGTFEGGPSRKAIQPAISLPDETIEKRMVPLANVKRRMQQALGEDIKVSSEEVTKLMFAATAFGKFLQKESLSCSDGSRMIEECHVHAALKDHFSDVLAKIIQDDDDNDGNSENVTHN